MYVYIQSEKHLWTVGFYDPSGEWHPDSDYGSTEGAADRVSWLNGSLAGKIHVIEKRLDELEKSVFHAANVASCLANGIIPD